MPNRQYYYNEQIRLARRGHLGEHECLKFDKTNKQGTGHSAASKILTRQNSHGHINYGKSSSPATTHREGITWAIKGAAAWLGCPTQDPACVAVSTPKAGWSSTSAENDTGRDAEGTEFLTLKLLLLTHIDEDENNNNDDDDDDDTSTTASLRQSTDPAANPLSE